MEINMTTNSAQLKQFHQILLWPLRLLVPDNKEQNAVIGELTKKNWAETTISKNYAEQVYFHPFIRQFLYGDADTPATVQVYERCDVNKIKVTLKSMDNPSFTLDVKRIQLYLFEVGIGILVVEVSSQAIENIKDIEDFLDQFRRAYPPYWDEWGAGHSPKSVEFFSKDNQSLVVSNFEKVDYFQQDVIEKKNFPVAAHWEYLLQPLVRYTGKNENSDKIRYQQVGDERIPYMAHLAFDDPHLLTRGDFIRLALADESENSDSFPYAEPFLKDFEERYCYDRYWENDDGVDKKKKWLTTRYLCCGYAFTMTGNYMKVNEDTNVKEPDFFINAEVGALSHFRRHYFMMGLIAHFHKAALLVLWDKLAKAVAKFTKKEASRREFKKEVHDILEELLHFTHRYWFTELSNQVQPKELFDWWSHHLGTRELFDRVMKEAQDAHQFLEMEEQKQQTDITIRLTVVATIGLAIGLVLGFFGGNYNVAEKFTHLTSLFASWSNWKWTLILTGFSFIFMMIVLFFSTPIARFMGWIASFWKK